MVLLIWVFGMNNSMYPVSFLNQTLQPVFKQYTQTFKLMVTSLLKIHCKMLSLDLEEISLVLVTVQMPLVNVLSALETQMEKSTQDQTTKWLILIIPAILLYMPVVFFIVSSGYWQEKLSSMIHSMKAWLKVQKPSSQIMISQHLLQENIKAKTVAMKLQQIFSANDTE